MVECPSCKATVDDGADSCPACGWQFNKAADAPTPTIVSAVTRPKLQVDVDLATTVDRTGSSDRFQVGIPATFEMIVSQVGGKARSIKVTVASHGDKDEAQDFLIHTDAGAPAQAMEDIKKIRYGGGGDPEEHHLDAIESLFDQTRWTADPGSSRGAIIAFTTSGSKPNTSGLTPSGLGQKIKEAGVLLYLVCERTAELEELAAAAEGLIFQISNNPDPAELQRIAAQLAASIVATAAAGGTVPMTVPA